MTEEELIQGCKDFSNIAQKELYNRYAGKMRGVCVRYIRNKEEVKDVLQEGFIKIFRNIQQYSSKGSLEGWMKRIMINTAITHYNKKKKNYLDSISDTNELTIANLADETDTVDSSLDLFFKAGLSQETLLESLNILSDSYRVVFNMFYIENLSHKEISELLGIDEQTSRSRLFRARKNLQKYLYELCIEKINCNSKVIQ